MIWNRQRKAFCPLPVEQNDDFFVCMFNNPDVMEQVMETTGRVLYERLRRKKDAGYSVEAEIDMVADGARYGDH